MIKNNNLKQVTPFLGEWKGKDEDVKYKMIVSEAENNTIHVELLEDNVQKQEYQCNVKKILNNKLYLKSNGLILSFNLENDEMIYTLGVDSTKKIEGTAKPIIFVK